jgi:uncharacterized alpha-E superfamily protein
MGIISVKHSTNLYWLGRYTERVFTTLNIFFDHYDIMLDKNQDSYLEFLDILGIDDKYGDHKSFMKGFLYHRTDSFSVRSTFRHAYDNALVLRGTIGSEALAYIQLASNTFKLSRDTRNMRLALIPVMDYLYAFWGIIDDKLGTREAGLIIKCGKLVERLDLYFRFSYDYQLIKREYKNLCHVLANARAGTPFFGAQERIAVLREVLDLKESYRERLGDALDCLSRLFEGTSA